MAVSNPFSLIQCPPGTGKKVLICGTTNVSINSLLEIVGGMVQIAGFKVCWPAASQRDFSSEDSLTKEQKLMTLFPSIKHNSREEKRFKALFNSKKKESK